MRFLRFMCYVYIVVLFEKVIEIFNSFVIISK